LQPSCALARRHGGLALRLHHELALAGMLHLEVLVSALPLLLVRLTEQTKYFPSCEAGLHSPLLGSDTASYQLRQRRLVAAHRVRHHLGSGNVLQRYLEVTVRFYSNV